MDELHYLLMKANALMMRRIIGEAGRNGLTSGQPKVLEFLSTAGEADQKTIAAYCEIEQATVGSILTRMEKDGLIIRRQHQGNRRSLFVSLTEKGQEAAKITMEIFRRADHVASSELSEHELEILKKALSKIAISLTTEKKDR